MPLGYLGLYLLLSHATWQSLKVSFCMSDFWRDENNEHARKQGAPFKRF